MAKRPVDPAEPKPITQEDLVPDDLSRLQTTSADSRHEASAKPEGYWNTNESPAVGRSRLEPIGGAMLEEKY